MNFYRIIIVTLVTLLVGILYIGYRVSQKDEVLPVQQMQIDGYIKRPVLQENEYHYRTSGVVRTDYTPEYADYTPDQDTLATYISKRYYVSKIYALQVVSVVYDTAARTHTDPMILLAIISVESRFNQHAMGTQGDIGLMQISPRWQQQLILEGGGEWPAWEVESNILLGARVLKRCMNQTKDITHALACYNTGPKYVGLIVDRQLRFQKLIKPKAVKKAPKVSKVMTTKV